MATLTNMADDYTAQVEARAVLMADKLDKAHIESIGEYCAPWRYCCCDPDNPMVVPHRYGSGELFCPKCGKALCGAVTYNEAFELIRSVTDAIRMKTPVLVSNPLRTFLKKQKQERVEQAVANLVKDTENAAILRQMLESGAISLS